MATPDIETPAVAVRTSAGTGTTFTRFIGLATIVGMVALAVFGLLLSPADVQQSDSVRILYILSLIHISEPTRPY